MIKTILIDDEILLLSSLEKIVKKYCPQITIVATCNNADDAIEKINELNPDLLLLDIAMPVKNGFDVLNAINYKNKEIIFVTAHNNFMLKAFKYSAIDYILKPIDEDDLVIAVNKAIEKIENKTLLNNIDTLVYNIKKNNAPQEMKLCLPTNNGFTVLELSDILVCIAEGAYTNFILKNNKKILVSRPLIDYDNLLTNNSFFRTHKSYLVNLNHIVQYKKGEGGSVLLTNGMEVEVSRRKKEEFLVAMKSSFKF